MSRGGYSNMLDVWSVGCIFGELLQRIARVGSATTPNLHIAPLFAVEGIPRTPSLGDCYMAGPSNLQTRRELDALFNVIGRSLVDHHLMVGFSLVWPRYPSMGMCGGGAA